MEFNATQLRCFKFIDVKPPSSFEQFEDTFSHLKLAKFGLLQQYLESDIFPNRDFRQIALNALSNQHAIHEIEQESTSNPQPADQPTSPSVSSAQFEDDLGEWTILLSDKAVTGLHNLRSNKSFEVIKKKLQELASGIWTGDNAKPLAGGPSFGRCWEFVCLSIFHVLAFLLVEFLISFRARTFTPKGIQIYEAKTLRNQRIVWQVDVAYVERWKATAQ
ncbi:hypothetical protein BC936DRAFT_142273, partial [Jimgerdemannia flammicorona]